VTNKQVCNTLENAGDCGSDKAVKATKKGGLPFLGGKGGQQAPAQACPELDHFTVPYDILLVGVRWLSFTQAFIVERSAADARMALECVVARLPCALLLRLSCTFHFPFLGPLAPRQVGSVNNTFGIKGVAERCFFLKSIEDAHRLRTHIRRAAFLNISFWSPSAWTAQWRR
jgi:hypothetical protein